MRGGSKMPSAAANPTAVEDLLVEVTSLLLERARTELEHEVEAAGGSASGDASSFLLRMRELHAALSNIRQERGIAGAMNAPESHERQVSRFYEVPGQEDA